jgi:site-specific DNA-methyltransferase (adenine-specific)
MQPYYEKDNITLFLGDCREVLPQIGTVNLVLTDPPYGEINADRDWKIKPEEYAGLLKACATPTTGAALFCSMRFAFDLHPAMVAAKWRYWTNFVWTKGPGGFKTGPHMPLYAHEHILCYLPQDADVKQVTFNGYESGRMGYIWRKTTSSGLKKSLTHVMKDTAIHQNGHPDGKRWATSVLDGASKRDMPIEDRTNHPTQKPLETVSRLVLLLTNPDDLVLDCFGGSGTTAVACKKLGRRCLMIEKDERWVNEVIQRLQQEVMVF